MSGKVAIIDCGTNTFHLLICSIYYQKGVILPEAEERDIDILTKFRQIIDDYKVTTIYAFGTSAFRNATNGNALRDRINNKLHLNLKIISGLVEAEYIYKGVNYALNIKEDVTMVMDIGGGSVEFVIGKEQEIYWKKSFEIGGQRMVERFHHSDPISTLEIELLEKYLTKNLGELFAALDRLKPSILGGSSGTFDTLSDIYCSKKGIIVDDQVPERPFDLSQYAEIHDQLITKNRADRLQIPGMIPMRVDMIVVASCLINFILKNYSFQGIRVSTYSLKEGALSEMITI